MFIEANIRYNKTFSSIKCEEWEKIGKKQCHGWTIGIGYILFSFIRHLSVAAIFAQEEEDKEKICCPAAGHG